MPLTVELLRSVRTLNFARFNPVLLGLWSVRTRITWKNAALDILNRYMLVRDAAHIYNCVKKQGILKKEWADMERYLSMHAEQHFKDTDAPSTLQECYFMYRASNGLPGAKPSDSEQSKDITQDLKGIFKIKTVAPLSAFIDKKQASWDNGMSADALARILRVDVVEDPASIISLLRKVRV